MKLSDLKTGQRVKVRGGRIFIVLRDVETSFGTYEKIFLVTEDNNFMPGSSYHEDMTVNRGSKNWDIMSVHEACNNTNIINFDIISDPIWERDERKEMTIAEIEKILGYKIKIKG